MCFSSNFGTVATAVITGFTGFSGIIGYFHFSGHFLDLYEK